jgi:hypothetical protein
VDDDLTVDALVGHGGLHADELGLSTCFKEELIELPATPAVLQACLERTARVLEKHNKIEFDVPPATWLEVSGEAGPIVPPHQPEEFDDDYTPDF